MKTLQGIVTSAKMTGTVTVTVRRLVLDPLYKKRFPVSKKFLVDLAGQQVGVGDEVEIAECRPLSKRKCFKVSKIIKKAAQLGEIAEESAVESVIHREKSAPKAAEKKPSSTAQ